MIIELGKEKDIDKSGSGICVKAIISSLLNDSNSGLLVRYQEQIYNESIVFSRRNGNGNTGHH